MGDTTHALSDVLPTTTTTPDPVVPLAALEAERKARQDLAAKLAEIEARQRSIDEADALKRGEAEKLYGAEKAARERIEAEHKATLERLSTLEARDAERRKARMTSLPEDFRDLVPDGLDGDKLDALLDKIEARARGATASAAPPTRPVLSPGRAAVEGGDPDALTPAEEAWARGKQYLGRASNASIKAAFAALHKPKP